LRQPAAATVSMKPRKRAYSSSSSTPNRHLTVTGTGQASCMAATHSATSAGSRIRQAPNRPACTRSEGQPQLRLTSSKPASAAMRAASASRSGSLPPNCRATGCSDGSIASSRARSPRITALAWTISVYRRACGARTRWNTRQWVSVQSIIGATDRRTEAAYRVCRRFCKGSCRRVVDGAGILPAGPPGPAPAPGWVRASAAPAVAIAPARLPAVRAFLRSRHQLAAGVGVEHVTVDVDRPRPAVIGGHEAALEPVEPGRAGADAKPLRQGAPPVGVAALPLGHHVPAGAADDLGDGTGVVDVAGSPARVEQLHDQRARGAVVAHHLVDERLPVAGGVLVDVAEPGVDPLVARAGVPAERVVLGSDLANAEQRHEPGRQGGHAAGERTGGRGEQARHSAASIAIREPAMVGRTRLTTSETHRSGRAPLRPRSAFDHELAERHAQVPALALARERQRHLAVG